MSNRDFNDVGLMYSSEFGHLLPLPITPSTICWLESSEFENTDTPAVLNWKINCFTVVPELMFDASVMNSP